MGTGVVYAGFFSNGIIGATVMRDNIFGASIQAVKDLCGRAIGECVIDDTGTGLLLSASADAINERLITVEGGLPALSDRGFVVNDAGNTSTSSTLVEGDRTMVLNDPDWFADIPYENADGTTYRVYLTTTTIPLDVGISRDTNRGYSRKVDVVGVTVNPSAVVDTGTELRLTITAGLNSLGVQDWLTTATEDDAYSMDVVVWLDTDVAGVTIAVDDPDIAIVTGKLHKPASGAGWVVDLAGLGDGYLGQANPSLTTAHYKIAILGPIVTTTNYDSNQDYILIGTVTSATGGDTTSTGGQIVIASVSSTVTALSDVPLKLLEKGWITDTAATVGVDSITIPSGNEYFIFGAIVAANSGLVGSFDASSELWLYYDANPGEESWKVDADWDTANGEGCLPYMNFITDGASEIIFSQKSAKFVKLFNQELKLTVSSDADHHPHFQTIGEALEFAFGLSMSNAVTMRGIVIEVVGDVHETETIDDYNRLSLENVTFRGRSGGMNYSTQYVNEGSRILWDFDGPLFNVNSTNGAVLQKWRFEDIAFISEYVQTAADHAVFTVTFGYVKSLQFARCQFIGSESMDEFLVNATAGLMAHAVHCEDMGLFMGLSFEDCSFYTSEAPISSSSDSGGILRLRVVGCRGKNDGVDTFSQSGFVRDLSTTGSEEWVISGNVMSELEGPAIRAYGLDNARIVDNKFDVLGDFSVIELGDAAVDAGVTKIWIRGNELAQVNNGGSNTEAIISIITADDSATVPGSIIISENLIDGVAQEAGNIGIELNESAQGGTTNMVILNHNIIINVSKAVYARNLSNSVIGGNAIQGVIDGIETVTTAGVVVAHNAIATDASGVGHGITGDADVVSANSVILLAEDGIGIELTGSANVAASGNFVNIADDTGDPTGIKVASGGVVSGNAIVGGIPTDDCILITADDSVAIGNHCDEGGIRSTGTRSGGIIAGNLLTGNGTIIDIANLSSGIIACNVAPIGDLGGVIDGVVIGNNFPTGDFTIESAAGVFVGNMLATLSPGTTVDLTSVVFGCNYLDTVVMTADDDVISAVGNLFTAAFDWDGNRGTFVGNTCLGDVEMLLGGHAVVGNRFDSGTFTDSGATNTVASNSS